MGSPAVAPGPTPPNGYQVTKANGAAVAQPPAGYVVTSSPSLNDDMFQSPADSTEQGIPSWIRAEVGTPETVVHQTPDVFRADGVPAEAYVEQGNTHTINVQDVGYNSSDAAHETTHLFQNTRNADFTDNLHSRLPQGTQSGKDYDYGGVEGLKKNHPNIGSLNAEQQASIVGELTRQQAMLHKNMTPKQLQEWDENKRALERPIQQLQKIPPKDTTSTAAKVDQWLDTKHPSVSAWLSKKIGTRPAEYLHDMVAPPKPVAAPVAEPEVPSVALGYAKPSKLVRGGENVEP